MKRGFWGVLIAVSALALSALGGCGRAASAPSVGGETHWLQHCGDGVSGFDCGPGLECVCGVCTSACTDDASCSGNGDDAVCAERGTTSYADGCESGAPQRLCVASSDVVLVTTAAPAPVGVGTSPDGDECRDGLFSTEMGCLACAEVRNELQGQRDELQGQYGSCSSDEDCVVAPLVSACDAGCAAGVNRQALEAYRQDMAVLDRAYCTAPDQWRAQCGVHSPNCEDRVALCNVIFGRCYVGANARPSCAGRSLDQCEDDSCTVATGTVYDPANECFSAQPVALRCVQRVFSCPPEPTPAVDAAGNCYYVGECIPTGDQGFLDALPSEPCRAALGNTCTN